MKKKEEKKININITPKELKAICKQYEYDENEHMMMTDEEDERTYLIKKAMSYLLPSDFIIFCLYMEYQSERKVAKILNCSRTPIHREIMNIKQQILKYL